jgi:hypothetical protein
VSSDNMTVGGSATSRGTTRAHVRTDQDRAAAIRARSYSAEAMGRVFDERRRDELLKNDGGQIIKTIRAHITKGDKAKEKSEQHYISAGEYLKVLKHSGTTKPAAHGLSGKSSGETSEPSASRAVAVTKRYADRGGMA